MLSRWQRHIVSESGDVIPDAEVEVTIAGDDTLADLYEDADGNTGKTNPFDADGGGYAFFYVAGGTYDIYVNGEKIWENVQLGTAQRRDIGTGTEDLPDVQAFGGPTPAEIGKGAIVESDTNDNGSYVRWENGEQVCWAKLTKKWFEFGDAELWSNRTIWDYPASFAEIPSVPWPAVAHTTNRTLTSAPNKAQVRVVTDEAGIGMEEGEDTITDDVTLVWIAWGVWK